MFKQNIPSLIPSWFQRIFPLPTVEGDEDQQLFAYQLYLYISIAFVIGTPILIVFVAVGRWVDVAICASYLLFSGVLLILLKNYPPERTASMMLGGAMLAVFFGGLLFWH